MKTSIKSLSRISIALIITTLYFLGSHARAQKVIGIYLSSTDFANNEISFSNVSNTKYMYKINRLFELSTNQNRK